MDKNQAKLDELTAHRDHTNGRIEELEQLIAEEQKPKLRHGDYGYFLSGARWLIIKRNEILEISGGCSASGMKASALPSYDRDGYVGNIFDDLAAMQEDVTEFEVKSPSHQTTGYLVHGRQSGDGNGFILEVTNYDGKYQSVRLDSPQMKKLALKLRQMEATLKRRAGK
jgi:hypothetical protein